MGKLILHLDLNNFYASVECLNNPLIADKPVAVSGDPKNRHGVVLAKNQIAKGYGVKTGDTVPEARKKAPGIVFVEPHFAEYDKLSKQMFEICKSVTSQVEAFGADECWLDCTASQKLFGSGREIADLLREKIKREMRLTASVGASFTKIFAKMGSDMKKPDATTVIDEDNFKQLIWPLPVREMCGVGRSTSEKLNKMNILTLGQLANADARILKAHFGKVGLDLKDMAAGKMIGEVRQAEEGREAKSVGHSLTAVRDIKTEKDIHVLVYYLTELVAARLKKHGFRASGVAVHIRTNDLEISGKQTTLPSPVCSVNEIAAAALSLVLEIWDGKPLRSMGVSTFHLTKSVEPAQLSFFDSSTDAKNERLDEAITALRKKFGDKAVIRGTQLDNDIFLTKDVGDFLPFKR